MDRAADGGRRPRLRAGSWASGTARSVPTEFVLGLDAFGTHLPPALAAADSASGDDGMCVHCAEDHPHEAHSGSSHDGHEGADRPDHAHHAHEPHVAHAHGVRTVFVVVPGHVLRTALEAWLHGVLWDRRLPTGTDPGLVMRAKGEVAIAGDPRRHVLQGALCG